MSEPARDRFYVVGTTGFPLGAKAGDARLATSYAVLDRLWARREVYSAYASTGGRGHGPAERRAACERVAEALNARHEQHMREVAT